MKDKEFYSKLIKTALPITFQNLMLALVAVSDSLMLGNLEQNMMAAVSLERCIGKDCKRKSRLKRIIKKFLLS